MRQFCLLSCSLLAISALLGGCQGQHQSFRSITDADLPIRCESELAVDSLSGLVRAFNRHDDGHRLLLLSGGGSRGAYGAGVLSSWAEQLPDPKEPNKTSLSFDLVTGISTGAIQATFAYLGDYKTLEKMFTDTTNKQVRKPLSFYWFRSARYSLAPLAITLEELIKNETVVEVGKIYNEKGNELWIGTTNLEAGRFCRWNLGRLAGMVATKHQQNPADPLIAQYSDFYRRLIQASSAGPPVFQPVEINGYTHVDGGVSQTIFFEAFENVLDIWESLDSSAQSPIQVHALINGKLVIHRKAMKSSLIPLLTVASRSISIFQKNATVSHLYRIKGQVEAALERSNLPEQHWDFYTTWIGAEQELDKSENFDPVPMRKLFCYGKTRAGPTQWCKGLPVYTETPSGVCDVPLEPVAVLESVATDCD